MVVFTPSYGRFHHIQDSERTASIRMEFAGRSRVAALYRVPSRTDGIEQYVIEHSLITSRQPGRIYFDDGASEPFASDATRFSFFSAAIAACRVGTCSGGAAGNSTAPKTLVVRIAARCSSAAEASTSRRTT